MIRIISGKLKGKKLSTLPGKDTRPTSDRLRESIFNILHRYPTPKTVIDLFAGTGAMGIEAISRGADFAYFVESSPGAIAIIKNNIHACGLEPNTRIMKWDIAKGLHCFNIHAQPADLIFMDPPYDRNLVHRSLNYVSRSPVRSAETIIVIEHAVSEPLNIDNLAYELMDQRRYGKTMVSFLR
jgi:16S rRNA (guanine(966)-N(2))-methyltransferase RsmD